ncbi:winged helix-turn-helix domain-containing protein [Tessaracoccus oleiagri]|nr:helix-turn-helix domain-containing protein [Tessaracoccus oleiagri]
MVERSVSAAALKAFAHPLRMAMYEYLGDHGPATSATLARVTGESTGQTSYHLRQLAKHGFISEVPGRGTARERFWKSEGFSFDLDVFDEAPGAETRTAVDIVQRQLVEQRVHRLLEWIDRQAGEEREWIEASISSDVTVRMTAPELQELQLALAEVTHDHVKRARARRDEVADEPGVRVVKLYTLGFPLPPEE